MRPVKSHLADINGRKIPCDISKSGKMIKAGLTPKETIFPRWMVLEFELPRDFLAGKKVLANGFQSWSETFTADCSTRIRNINPVVRLLGLDRYGDYHFYRPPSRRGFIFSHEYLRIFATGTEAEILFAGNLTPEKAYGIFEIDFKQNKIFYRIDLEGLLLDPGKEFTGIELFSGESAESYFDHRRLKVPPDLKSLTGWTSWYNYYEDITEKILLENLRALSAAGIPLDVFQIDDGYQQAVGDWLTVKESFPRGMKYPAKEIREKGYIPGLWLAPFAVEKKSELFKKHGDLLVRNRKGRPEPAGYNPGWGGIFHALDIYKPGTKEYLSEVFRTVTKEWGYGLLKLDFLQAAGVLPLEGKARAGVMYDAFIMLNSLKGESLLLGCGAPLGPAAGMFDYMRIGSDIAPCWEDQFLKKIGYRERVSTANSLSSTLNRDFLNGRAWLNDPDVFILRETREIKMTGDEKKKLFETNLKYGGLLFFSDDVRTYPPETIRLLKSEFANFREKE